MKRRLTLTLICWLFAAAFSRADAAPDDGFAPLFADDGAPSGWDVRLWSDVAKAPPAGAQWKVTDGVLQGSAPRGTWLVSRREFGDFVLRLEFQLGERGNGGLGLRFPPAGDPAFDGLEVQLVDPRYYGADSITPAQLTGSLYPLIAPSKQAYKPTDWNECEITCQGPRVRIMLNGERIQDVNLDAHTEKPERGSSLAERPRRGHIGFQELSRGGSQVRIRHARIKEL